MASAGAVSQINKDRQVNGMERRSVGSDFSSEVAILLLLLVSGAAGLVTSSPVITGTMFLGGLTTWLVLTLPDYLRAQQRIGLLPQLNAAAQAVSEDGPAGKEDGGAASPAAAVLPAPDAVLSLIKKRRSVFPKDYSGDKVPREQVEMLLEAANWAPTHGQTEPWRFVVLEGESKREMEDLTLELCRTRLPEDKAAKTLEKLQKKRDSTWGKISCQIAICCKRQAKPEKLMPEWEEMAAVACAVQNMALLATSMGVAAYWTSWQEVARESPEMKSLLGLAPEDRVMGFLTLGCIQRDRLAGYRAGRGPWQDKVVWKR